MIYITMFAGYDPAKRYCIQKDKVSRTIQDAVVDVPSLLKQFDGHLDDLFNKYNNGLMFESEIGVFVDELNAKEVAAFNDYQKKQAELKALQEENDRLFELWKAEQASKVAAARTAAATTPAAASAAPAAASAAPAVAPSVTSSK